MKPILSTVVLITSAALFSACAASEQQTSSTPAPSATAPAEAGANAEQEVRRVQQEYDKAWLQQDAAAFERLLADEVMQINEEGKVFSKAEIVANAKSGTVKFEVGQSGDIKVRVYGDTALVSGRWTEKSTRQGKQVVGAMQMMIVYVKRNGNWQVVSDQITLIAAPKP